MNKQNTPPAAESTLQALTLAISAQGISNFFVETLSLLVEESFILPDKPGVITNEYIPLIPCSLFIDTLDLSGGRLSDISATLLQIQQQANGLFTISLQTSFDVAYSDWHEKGSVNCPPPCSNCMPPPPIDFDQHLDDFNFSLGNIDLTFDLQLSETSGQWTVTVSNTTQANVKIGKVHIPKKSNLNSPSIFKCINKRIKDKMDNAIRDTNFAANMQTALSNMFKTIPTSGVVYSSGNNTIVYQFPATYINFPGNNGMEAGVTGQVLCNNTAYAGAPIVVPAASIVPAKDVNVYAGTYEFNALLWAYYTCGLLQTTITPSMIPDPQYLNTNYYKRYLPQLYNFAPGADMTITIAANETPLVNTGPIFWLSPGVMSQLQAQLPGPTYKKLNSSTMVNVIYPTLILFNQALANTLSSGEYQSYSALIDTAAQTTGLFAASQFLFTVNVIKQDEPVFAFSFQAQRSDVLTNLQLGIIKTKKGNAQTILFLFNEYGDPNPTIVQSAIGDISQLIFDFAYGIADYNIDQLIQQAGNTGVPLPLISGFLFTNASITIQENYLTVATNILFGNMNQYTSRRLQEESFPAIAPRKVHRIKTPGGIELLPA